MKIDVSNGELVDKVTILAIKSERVTDAAKLENIRKEHALLEQAMHSLDITASHPHYGALKEVNEKLWEIEDRIRIKEQRQEFDDEFIQLARSVYFENDTRAEIKKTINVETGSDLVEEKQYVEYKGDDDSAD